MPGFNPQTQFIVSRYTHYVVPAHKTSKTRYNEHISYTSSNNPQVTYAEQTLNNSHEYARVDEIRGLAISFTERSENERLRKFPYKVTQM